MSTFNKPVTLSIEIMINLLLILFIVAWCLQILMPFISFILWGAVIAISVYAPYVTMREKLGNKLAVTLFTVLGLALVLVPAWLFADSIFQTVKGFAAGVESASFEVPPPNSKVESWPVVGEPLYAAWASAASDFEQFLEVYSGQLKTVASTALSKAAGMGSTVLQFVLATIIAAAMLANEAVIAHGLHRLFRRLVGAEQGEEMLDTVAATVRSVTIGVLGIAFIQALAAGIGMVAVGVPAAGVFALVVLIFAIAQIPVLLVMLPLAIYVFSVESTTTASIFAVYAILVAVGDAPLKAVFLGRGVAVPTLVILLGAIGGMLMSGIIGLFVGAVVLALGYQLFIQWLKMGEPQADSEAEAGGR